MDHKIDVYDDFASQYSDMIGRWEEGEVDTNGIIPQFLHVIGDVSGLKVLDAGCGEGYLSRILARRGANVTGIDIAPNLVQIARSKDPEGRIEYKVADLSQPLSEYQQHFDLIASHLVLNDVFDYQGFLATLGASTKRGGRLVFVMNNPYSYVVRNRISNYFDSGKAFLYRGMSQKGIKVHFYQRTLQEYMDACLGAGFQLQRLVDLPTPERILNNFVTGKLLPKGYQFPYFMILSFIKT
ncbi:MAG TPA: class I SAM-dependent methyltransferase [Ktedonobacteraceae bacterium]|nr:class I SAM-dependent methyltransferase [Ktedonobacteraceae bacterium]